MTCGYTRKKSSAEILLNQRRGVPTFVTIGKDKSEQKGEGGGGQLSAK